MRPKPSMGPARSIAPSGERDRMSYLNTPRLAFAGRFLANPSTINNALDNYNPAVDLTTHNVFWNPQGLHDFAFRDCTIRSVTKADGTLITSSTTDACVGAAVATNEPGVTQPPDERVGVPPYLQVAKIVDLDPDQQMLSQIFGLKVAIRLPGGGKVYGRMLAGQFQMLFTKRVPSVRGQAGFSAYWQSVIDELHWTGDLSASPALTALQSCSRLSIKFVTEAYTFDRTNPDTFATGRVVGVIGPQTADEPIQYAVGRHLNPVTAGGMPPSRISGGAHAFVDADAKLLHLDWSNATQLQAAAGEPTQPRLYLAYWNGATPVAVGGAIDVSKATLEQTGGVTSMPILEGSIANISTKPLSLFIDSSFNDALCNEDTQGRYANIERTFVRMDSGGPAVTLKLSATKFGQPWAGQVLSIATVPVPFDGRNEPAVVTASRPDPTDVNGKSTITFTCGDFLSTDLPTRRQHIDSQVYFFYGDWMAWGQINYSLSGLITVLAHPAGPAVTSPDWSIVGPIFQSYARLYPGMRAILNLSLESVVKQNAAKFNHALSLPIDNPGFMPVTRDLSQYKLGLMTRYLNGIISESSQENSGGVA